MTTPEMLEYLFVDLSELTEEKEIDGMAKGTFTSMWGRSTKIDKLETYVKNTTENLEGTRTESGELVGLPIDAYGHDQGDGAGWITGVRQDGDVVRFAVKWTTVGLELIKKKIRRFFSPTLDVDNRVILGGSLTNWPATRTEKGKILLRPIELSQQIQSIDPDSLELSDSYIEKLQDAFNDFLQLFGFNSEPKKLKKVEDDLMDVKISDLTPEQIAELQKEAISQLSENPTGKLSELIDAAAEEKLQAQLKLNESKAHVVEFATRVTAGDDESPVGLPVEKDRLVDFMTSLDSEQQKEAEEILSLVHSKAVIEFDEKGHRKPQHGTAELSNELKSLLQDWIKSGQTVAEFFAENQVELGEMSAYNLSEFEEN